MKKWFVLGVLLIISLKIDAQNRVTLEADYTSSVGTRPDIQYPLNVFNRISPINGFRSPIDLDKASLCLVRPLGGVSTQGQPDLARDTYKWNGNEFVTDFAPLKRQIDRVYNQGFGIYQIVLDNPSWDFQRDSNGNLPGGAYKGETYGNAEPPTDFNAWARYLREVMSFLVSTYGREEMLKVQFGIGREIGTRGHWTGTQDQFFRFYKRSVEAVQSVLPEAKIGSHFLWASANNSWGSAFVKWCKENNVPYDFVGVSYYPAYNRANRTNFKEVYRADFGAIRDLPEWDTNAKFEIHEFALTSSFGGNSFESAPSAYQNSFLVGWMKQFFEHGIDNLFQWGPGDHFSPANIEILALRGNTYHRNTIQGTQRSTSNYVDAIFTSDVPNNKYNIMAYNYNSNPRSNVSEDLRMVATVNAPNGTNYRYRSGVYNKADSSFSYSSWINGETSNGTGNKSKISFNRSLPVFSFLKYEIEIIESNTTNQPPIVSVISPVNNATYEVGQEITLSANASDPDGNLDKVNFKINDDFYRSSIARPFETTFTPTETGTYKIAALAIDKENAKTEVFVNITVVKSNADPLVEMISPSNNATFELGNEISISAGATDPDGNLDKVNFFINDEIVLSDAARPFETTFTPTAIGTYTIIARAIDKENAKTDASVTITVVEKNKAPTASFTTPISNKLEEGYSELVVTVDATDPNGDDITVVLKIDGKEIRSESVAPYEWGHAGSPNPSETVGLAVGDHVFEAVVTDAKGLSTTILKTITVDRVTGTSSVVDRNELTVFPNPSNFGVFKLNEDRDWQVYNLNGINILSGKSDRVDLSSETKGVYFLKINGNVIQLIHY